MKFRWDGMFLCGSSVSQQTNKATRQQTKTATTQQHMNRTWTKTRPEIHRHLIKKRTTSKKDQPKINQKSTKNHRKSALGGSKKLLGRFPEFQKNLIASWTEKWAEHTSAPSGILGPCWAQVGTKLGPSWAKLGPSGPEVGPRWFHIGSKTDSKNMSDF